MRIDDVLGHTDSARGIAATIGDIDSAADEPQLIAGIDGARRAVEAELRAHTPTLTLAAAWSEVIKHSLATAVRVTSAGAEPGWTWFVSGSVARGEAIPGSDVETLVELADDVDEAGKTDLLSAAADVHALLERCGLPPDDKGVLASRSRFCRRRSSWAEGIEKWSAHPAEDRGVVMTGLLADAVALRGDDDLRAMTGAAVARHPDARAAMLQDATAVRAGIPSRLRIFATHDDSADLKVAALDPIVKIARWAALSAGSKALSTLERFNEAAAAKVLDADDASILRDCYLSLSRIRWRTRAAAWIDGQPVTDRVALSTLAPQDRAALRSIDREVSGIRRKLKFLASTSSFR